MVLNNVRSAIFPYNTVYTYIDSPISLPSKQTVAAADLYPFPSLRTNYFLSGIYGRPLYSKTALDYYPFFSFDQHYQGLF